MTEHHLGTELTDDQCDPTPRLEVAVELAVDVPEEPHVAGVGAGQPSCRLPLLVLPAGHERRRVGGGVPGALRPVGAHEVVHDAPGGRPLRQHAATPELDVVGVRPDGECAGGGGQVGAERSVFYGVTVLSDEADPAEAAQVLGSINLSRDV